jgi:capsular exopolysaccharide synthesis family protein
MLQQMSIEEAAHRDLCDNLTVLTSGPIPPNPAEILGSQRARDFWEEARKSFDYIFIDAPPVLAVTDAVVLSTYVEGVVLVVRSSVTRNELAREAKNQLVRANARILGVVMNQVKMEAKDYYYYYYYYGESSEAHN